MESIFKLRHLQTVERSSVTIKHFLQFAMPTNFTPVDIGQFGSNNDSGVLANLSIGRQFEENRITLPAGRHVPGCPYSPLPYY